MSVAEVERAFTSELANHGVFLTKPVIADGKKHRARVDGARSDDVEYTLYPDGVPNGRLFSFHPDTPTVKWVQRVETSSNWQLLTGLERQERRKEWQRKREADERAEREEQAEAAAEAARRWNDAGPPDPAHPYLVTKGVQASAGVRQHGDALVIPVITTDESGHRISAVQTIDAKGRKFFLPVNSRTSGGYFRVRAIEDAPSDVIVLAEGYATGMTLHAATGCEVFVAFTCYQLGAVGRLVRAENPNARLVFAADNDHVNKDGTKRPTEVNAGVNKARAAAEAVHGCLMIPPFADFESGTDWNDVARDPARGLAAVRSAFDDALAGGVVPLNTLAASSSLAANDLATKADAAAAVSERRALLVRADCVVEEETKWLWPKYLPFGEIVMLDGAPGVGKSTIAIDVAARLSRGHVMPDGSGGSAPADTVYLSYEDDPAKTLNPRARAAGADLSRILYLRGIGTTEDDAVPPCLPEDLAKIEGMLAANPTIRLLIIDTLMAALSAGVDSHRDQDVRRVLSRLARLAHKTNVCVLIIRHPRKAGGTAINAGGGSIGIIGQARGGLVVGKSSDNATAILAQAKNNLGPTAPSLSFRKVAYEYCTADGKVIRTSLLEWNGPVAVSADELTDESSVAESVGAESAAHFVSELLAEVPRLKRQEVMSVGRSHGHGERTLDYAAKRLGVVRKSEGFGRGKCSYWSLPLPAAAGAAQVDPARNSATTATPADNAGIQNLAEMAMCEPVFRDDDGERVDRDASDALCTFDLLPGSHPELA